MKKKLLLSLIVIIILVTSSCTKPRSYLDYELLTPETEDIKDTMLNFFSLDRKVFKDKNFQVKVIDIVAIKKNNEVDDITYYLYNLVIAPVTEMPIHIKSIHIQPQDERYQKYLITGDSSYGPQNLEIWNLITNQLDFFQFNEVKDLPAYRLTMIFNDLGSKNMAKHNFTRNQIDEAIKNFEITIKYNNTQEIIKVNLDEVYYLNPETDVELLGREDISNLYYDNKLPTTFEPYRSE